MTRWWQRRARRTIGSKYPNLQPNNYTMLVAWNKFDRYERSILARLMGIPLDKLSFTLVTEVWDALLADERRMHVQLVYEYPVANFRKRLVRAVEKEKSKRRQRIKL